MQSFLLTHEGRAPNPNAEGMEGKFARHVRYNIDKMDGRKSNPEVEGYVYGKSEPLRKKSTAGTKPPQAKIILSEETKPADLENGALDLKPVDAYYPAWREELGAMFDKEQLDTVGRTFAATDDWLFVRGEDGKLTVRNPNEWDYEARFLMILQNSGVSFTHKQIKQLIGGTNSRGFKFYNYFTLRHTMSFVLATGHLPRKGLQVSLTELRKQADAGDSQAAELVRELTLGHKILLKGGSMIQYTQICML